MNNSIKDVFCIFSVEFLNCSDMKWITRERPKIDRIACPWLIKRFIDKDAEIIYAPFDEVKTKAKKINATPFDIPDVEFTHYGDDCTFDYFVKKYKIKDPAIKTMAIIVRGADTDRHDIAIQSSGLWAISAGLSRNITDDYQLLEKGMEIYDALYTWAKYLQKEKHTQNPIDHLLMDVYNKFLKQKPKTGKKIPVWAKELKEIIQDQIDTNLSLSLKEVSKGLSIHPSYVSREFSKSAPIRSILLIKTITGVLRMEITSISLLVCSSTPFTLSTTSTTLSTAVNVLYVSSAKSSWPGVSKIFTLKSR